VDYPGPPFASFASLLSIGANNIGFFLLMKRMPPRTDHTSLRSAFFDLSLVHRTIAAARACYCLLLPCCLL
jgi:hypothetical protein